MIKTILMIFWWINNLGKYNCHFVNKSDPIVYFHSFTHNNAWKLHEQGQLKALTQTKVSKNKVDSQ